MPKTQKELKKASDKKQKKITSQKKNQNKTQKKKVNPYPPLNTIQFFVKKAAKKQYPNIKINVPQLSLFALRECFVDYGKLMTRILAKIVQKYKHKTIKRSHVDLLCDLFQACGGSGNMNFIQERVDERRKDLEEKKLKTAQKNKEKKEQQKLEKDSKKTEEGDKSGDEE